MKLKDYIKKKGLTETEIAAHIGITQQHINQLARMLSNPSLPLAKKIQEKTNGLVTIEEMLNPELPSRLDIRRKKKKMKKPKKEKRG